MSDGETRSDGAEPTATLARRAEPGMSSATVDATTTIPGYVLVRELGTGAYGRVWQAVRVGTGQDVAVKVYTAPGRLDWRYLQREVDHLMRVAEHPHIVTLLDAGLQHDPPFYAMAFLRKGSLADLCVRGTPFPEVGRVVQWFEQMASALEFAHGKGLMHCDLKPANVLLDEEDSVRLADFGQSQWRGEAAFALGTLAYMAPEQAVVATDDDGTGPTPTAAWDIYALGATMYALLAGQPPHGAARLPATLTQIESAHARLEEYRRIVEIAPVAPLVELNPAVDPDLAAIIHHCLAPDPDRRYRHIEEVTSDLRRRRERRPLRCLPPSTIDRVQRFVRRNLGMVVIAAAAALALTTVVLEMSIRHDAERVQLTSRVTELQTQRDNLQADVDRLREQLSTLAGPAALKWPAERQALLDTIAELQVRIDAIERAP